MKPPISRLVPATSVLLYSLVAATTALGQITPDNTLGNESSVVTPNVNVNGALADLIEGGAIRDSNLFHSFSDFNVAEFAGAYFANPAGVANILSRVTGGNVSNILGTLGVLGNANLFLINPNGIIFGLTSRLDLRGGSFFGSTAESVLFDNGTVFSTKNPNGKPLLTINIPSGLQYGSNPGSITNQSLSVFGFGLEVPNGQTLGLIGGDVNIPGGDISAFDGRIELGSVGANGVVNLTPTDTTFELDYSGVQAFQDISLSEVAFVTTIGFGGGSIQVQGANVSLRDRSLISASTLGSENGGGIEVRASQLSLEGGSRILANVLGSGQGGDLTVNASESVQVIGTFANGLFPSALFTETLGKGNAGDISITTGQLIVSDGAVVSTSTVGEGNGGNLTVDASESVQVIGTSASGGFRSRLFAETEGTGNAGELKITTGQLIVSDGAVVSTSTVGEGNGGNLIVDASESVQVIGTSASGGFRSGLLSQANPEATGNAGELKITTGQLIVKDGAQVSASTVGEGEGGNVTVDASESVQVIGTSADDEFANGLFAVTQGKGNAGDVKITTGQLIVKDGASVSTGTVGEGNGGNLTVDASESVQIIGTSPDGQSRSGLFTQANREATGNAGELKITTGQLMLKDGAQVSASTLGQGNGGNLTVDANSTVELIGTSPDGQFTSGLFTQTEGKGNAGELNIATGELIISDGAQVSTITVGEGDGGILTVDASSKVQVIGTSVDGRVRSGLFTQTNGKGNAGEFLEITTGKLIISDGARVSALSFQEGTTAGTVKINANSIFLDNGGRITAETAGPQGNINLFSRDIRLLNRSLILTDGQNATGGNIFIDTDTLVGLGNSDITANALEGEGGNVTINAQGIFGLEFRDRLTPDNDITATSNRGPLFDGEVEINISQVDPTSGLNELPGILVDAEAILANDLCGFENDRIAGGSSFTIIGKGGLPPTPEDPVINAHRTVRWRTRPGLASSRQPLQAQAKAEGHESRSVRPRQEKKVIIEAQGWVVAKDGTIILTAQPFNGTPVEQIFPNLDCHSGIGNRE
ncbi:MAG: S-layer family protein [Moorea sp. SIO3C2]|nr:S-layer family protein [Moorena sp. SIO3C2]